MKILGLLKALTFLKASDTAVDLPNFESASHREREELEDVLRSARPIVAIQPRAEAKGEPTKNDSSAAHNFAFYLLSHTPSRHTVGEWLSATVAASWFAGATFYNSMVRHGIIPIFLR